MESYRVSHRKSGTCFYVLAGSPAEAIEKVTLRIGDAEGLDAWAADPAAPPSPLAVGRIVDRDGKPIKTMMA